MRLDPVAGDVDAPGDPDALVLLHVVEQPLAGRRRGRDGRSARMCMPTDIILRLGLALAIEHVEGVLQQREPLVGVADARHVLAVVGGERVGHDQVAACRRPSARTAARRRSSRCRRGSRLPRRPGGACSRWARSGSTSRRGRSADRLLGRGDRLARCARAPRPRRARSA